VISPNEDIISSEELNEIAELYTYFNENIKPLIALIELVTQSLPLQVFNEVRNFTDHISKCFAPTRPEGPNSHELKAAKAHLRRLRFDSLKLLNFHYEKLMRKFWRKTHSWKLEQIDNGEFLIKIRKEYRSIKTDYLQAKKIEVKDYEESFSLYDSTLVRFMELDNFIEEYYPLIICQAVKKVGLDVLKVILWILTAGVAGFVSFLFSFVDYKAIWTSICGWF